jgi:hypothetical protein
VHIVPRPEIERRWRDHRVRKVAASRRKHERRVRGLDLVLSLEEGRSIEFRGRQYGVPPVPWAVALDVLAVQERFTALAASTSPANAEWARCYKDVARLFKRAVRPVGWLRRLLWPLTPSPLRNAAPVEVGKALGFFCVCLSMDAEWSQTRTPPPHGTSPRTSPASLSISPRGATAAFHAPGAIS